MKTSGLGSIRLGKFPSNCAPGSAPQLAGFRQLAHQGEGFGGDPEAQAGVAGGEARYAQDPQGILGERRGTWRSRRASRSAWPP